MARQRRFLFLQGPASPFFSILAKWLRAQGHSVSSISFCIGDELFCPRPFTRYKDTVTNFEAFLSEHVVYNKITDLIIFGDCRPIHKQAKSVSRKNKIQFHVFECGYYRPSWITYEINGVNVNSEIFDSTDHFLGYSNSQSQKKIDKDFGSFFQQAVFDIAYHLLNFFNFMVYPNYQRHIPASPFIEYFGILKQMVKGPILRQKSVKLIEWLITYNKKFYLLPLQLDRDFQIREHSPYDSMTQVIEEVLLSFAKKADKTSYLVIKLHPLDAGLINLKKWTEDYAKKLSIKQNVFFIEAGAIDLFVKKSKGVVTVNSTVGLLAINYGVKLKVLGKAFYQNPNLCFAGSLDAFWESTFLVKEQYRQSFYYYVMDKTQVNGGLYDLKGIKLAVENLPKIMRI